MLSRLKYTKLGGAGGAPLGYPVPFLRRYPPPRRGKAFPRDLDAGGGRRYTDAESESFLQ